MDTKEFEEALKEAFRDAMRIGEDLAKVLAIKYAPRMAAIKAAALAGDVSAQEDFETLYANAKAEEGLAEIMVQSAGEERLLAVLSTAMAFFR